jgi:hypothetical protein
MSSAEGRPPGADDAEERGLGELFSAATEDFQGLIRDEIALAKAEMRGTFKGIGIGGGGFGAAAILLVASVPVLSIAAGYGIHAWWGWPLGWSFAFVGGLFWVLAAVLGIVGVRGFKKAKAPKRAFAQNKLTMKVLGRAKPRQAPQYDAMDAAVRRAIEERNSRPALDHQGS